MDLDNPATSNNSDEVLVQNAPTQLGGTLNINLPNGWTPTSAGTTYTLLIDSSGITGTFATVNILDPTDDYTGSSYSLSLDYTSTAVYAVVVATPSAPTITSVSPASSTTAGGQAVTITGTNLGAIQSLLFGDEPATSYTVVSSTQINAVAPANPTTASGLTLTTSAGSTTASFTYTAGSDPVVSSVSPTSGYLSGGVPVTITGSNFTGATDLYFGSVAAPAFWIDSDTEITAYAPPASSAGTVDVTVSDYTGTSAITTSDEYDYVNQPAPTVTALSPSSGSSIGGNTVTITGTYFANVDSVYFGGVPAPNFTVVSSTSITATVPPGVPSIVDVTVATAGGVSALNSGDRYTYSPAPVPIVTGLSTSSGTTAGGTQVIVSGSGFTSATQVLFGANPAYFVFDADNQITAFSPSQAAGTVDVTVVAPGGTSGTSTADQFTYTNATGPSVSGVSPATGTTAGGNTVTISGSDFTGATAIAFGSVLGIIDDVVNDSTIIATVPSQAAGTVHVIVTTPSGTSSTSTADEYVYTNAASPTVSGLDVTGGPTTGGTEVTITGSALSGATSINFGSVSTTDFLVNSDNSITVTAPPGAAGTVHVTVTTPSGTSATSSADEFVYSTASSPSISSFSTTSTTTAGGTLVTLSGSGFSDVYAVTLGDLTINDFTVNSDSQITFVTPPDYAGVWDISVTSPAGTSALSSSTQMTYSLGAAPVVSSLDVSSGSTAGGTTVNLTGSYFTGAFNVLFGDEPASSFVVNSDSSITAVAPPQAAGTVDVKVQTYAGMSESTSSDHYAFTSAGAPTVDGLATTGGSTAGGTLVTIDGSNLTAASSVLFGSVSAFFVVNPGGSIGAYAPPQAAGTVDVTFITPSGTSATSSADQFTYTAAASPSVNSVVNNSGPTTGGTAVTILGSGFTSASAVTFSGTEAASYVINSDTSITAWTPNLPAGTLDIQVTTPSGTSSTSSSDLFTVTNVTAAAPTVTGLSLTSGSTAGGTTVLVSGTNFSGTTAIDVGGTAATSYTVLDDSDISIVIPAGSAGAVHVTVTTNNGTSSTTTADEFTFLATAAPTVTGLGTSSGSTAGGASVVITGTNFSSGSTVSFGGFSASVVYTSSTSLTATAPALPVGTYDVTVTTPSDTSATSSSDVFTVTAASLPTVSSLGTTSGSSAGGTSVVITGTNFTGAVGVFFGDEPASSFTVTSSTSITATAPAQLAGAVDVTVSTYAGTSATSSSTQFSYSAASAAAVSGLSSSSGSTAGNDTITISGSNFTSATEVLFGGVDASSFTIVSSSSITAVTPPEFAGTVDLKVVTPSGNSASSSSDEYTFSAATAPSVSSLSTSSGSTAGGDTITISGSNFDGLLGVSFGGVAATVTAATSTSVTVVSPSQAAGTVDVTVTTTAGTSTTVSADQFTYNAASAPSVSGLDVTSGPTTGDTTVTIQGSDFTGASEVDFGSVAAAVNFVSDNVIVATAPAQAAGTVDVTVTTPSGTSSTSYADQFTYSAPSAPTISSLDTNSGSTAGGTAVTITGTGFDSLTTVDFGGVPAEPVILVSPTEIIATSPAETAGTIDVSVSNENGTSALGSADRYTFVAAAAPTVTGVSPTSVSTNGTTTVTISGTDLLGATAVTFGSMPGTIVSDTDTSLTATAPVQAAGTVDVVVSTPTGTSATSSSDQVTYSNATVPSVTGVSPNTGSISGGTVVTITGSDFTGVTAVDFGSVAVTPTFYSDGQITATAPEQTTTGTVDVTVVSASGTSSTSSADQFTYTSIAAPTVSSVTASSGSVLGGDTITVIGTGFTSDSSVSFGGVAATFVQMVSATALLAVDPAASSTGTVDVTVTTVGGTSSTGSADQFTYTSVSSPSVSGLGVTSGDDSGGTVVVISGSGFTGATSVSFGSYPATPFVNSDSQITVVAPAQAAGTVDVTVTTPAGTSSIVTADEYTFSSGSAPTVTEVSPAAGPLAGTNTVLIDGTNLTDATAVYFGGTAAPSFSVNPDGSLFAVAPSGSAGTVDVTVTTLDGTSTTSSADYYTYEAAPTLSSLSFTSGSVNGGWTINLTGTGFSDATEVWFGTVIAASMTINSSTSITVVDPAEPAGAVNVTVVGPGGTSGGQTFTYANPASGVEWVGGTSGDWDTASNWNINAVPDSTDEVTIGSGDTVTLSSGYDDSVFSLDCSGTLVISSGSLSLGSTSSITNLTLSGGTLKGDGDVTFSGTVDWTSGTMSGSGLTTFASTATVSLASSSNMSLLRNVNNAGTVDWTGSGWLVLEDGDTWDNQSGSLFDDQVDSTIDPVVGLVTFNNEGTFTKSGGTGTTTLDGNVALNNSGTTNVNDGTLLIHDAVDNSGTINIATGCLLQIAGLGELESTSDITGGGSIEIASNTTTLGGTINVSGGLTIDSGATATGTGSITGNVTNDGTLTVGSGTAPRQHQHHRQLHAGERGCSQRHPRRSDGGHGLFAAGDQRHGHAGRHPEREPAKRLHAHKRQQLPGADLRFLQRDVWDHQRSQWDNAHSHVQQRQPDARSGHAGSVRRSGRPLPGSRSRAGDPPGRAAASPAAGSTSGCCERQVRGNASSWRSQCDRDRDCLRRDPGLAVGSCP